METIWTDSKRGFLLERVNRHPSLWDKTHRYYSRKDINNRKWNKIGKYLGVTGEDASHQFSVLKQRFTRHIKRAMNGYYRPFLFEDKMYFLKAAIEKIELEARLLANVVDGVTVGAEVKPCNNLVEEAKLTVVPTKVKSLKKIDIGSVPKKRRGKKVNNKCA